jgi:hypothetical protein
LDFGVKQFRSLAQQCSFPWLIANVLGWWLQLTADNSDGAQILNMDQMFL